MTRHAGSAQELQDALDWAEQNGGGTVELAPITIEGRFVIGSNTKLVGQGRGSVLRLPADGENGAVLRTRGFWALQGGRHVMGAGSFTLQDFTLDANRAANPDGGGLYIYGWDYRISNLWIQNYGRHGMWSEYGGYSAPADTGASTSAYINGLKIFDGAATSHGLHFLGPHDSNLNQVTTAKAGLVGQYFDGDATGIQILNGHSWGPEQDYSYFFGPGAPGCELAHVQGEGGARASVGIHADNIKVRGGTFYVNGPAQGGGFEIGDVVNTNIDSEVNNVPWAVKWLGTRRGVHVVRILNRTMGETRDGRDATHEVFEGVDGRPRYAYVRYLTRNGQWAPEPSLTGPYGLDRREN